MGMFLRENGKGNHKLKECKILWKDGNDRKVMLLSRTYSHLEFKEVIVEMDYVHCNPAQGLRVHWITRYAKE